MGLGGRGEGDESAVDGVLRDGGHDAVAFGVGVETVVALVGGEEAVGVGDGGVVIDVGETLALAVLFEPVVDLPDVGGGAGGDNVVRPG